MKLLPFAILPLLLSACFMGPPKTHDYTGRYVDPTANPSFQMQVDQSAFNANLSFMTGKTAAKPVGTGVGNIDHDGVLVFSFEDRSGNQGTGKLEPTGDRYRLSTSPTNMKNPKTAVLVGSKVLEKR